MLVYINDSKFWDLVKDADRVLKIPSVFRFTNRKHVDTYVRLLYNETESMRINLSASYSNDDEEDGLTLVFRLKSTGLVFGTRVLEGESAKDKALECLKKNSNRIFHDVTIWRKEHNR